MKVIYCSLFIVFLTFTAHAQVNTENLRKADLAEGWHNAVRFDMSYAAGNSSYLTLRGRWRTDYVRGAYTIFGVAQYQRGFQGDVVFLNRAFAHVRGMRTVHKRLEAEVFLQREFNDFTRLDSRNLVGTGARIRLHPSDSTGAIQAFLGIGAMWESERLKTDPPEETDILRSTNYISLNWTIRAGISFGLIAYYQAHVTNWSDQRILLEAGLSVQITSAVTFQTSLDWRYDSQPPPAVRGYDLALQNGLTISF